MNRYDFVSNHYETTDTEFLYPVLYSFTDACLYTISFCLITDDKLRSTFLFWGWEQKNAIMSGDLIRAERAEHQLIKLIENVYCASSDKLVTKLSIQNYESYKDEFSYSDIINHYPNNATVKSFKFQCFSKISNILINSGIENTKRYKETILPRYESGINIKDIFSLSDLFAYRVNTFDMQTFIDSNKFTNYKEIALIGNFKELVPLKILELVQENKILQSQTHTAYKLLNLSSGETYDTYCAKFALNSLGEVLPDMLEVFHNISEVLADTLNAEVYINKEFNSYNVNSTEMINNLKVITVETTKESIVTSMALTEYLNKSVQVITNIISERIIYQAIANKIFNLLDKNQTELVLVNTLESFSKQDLVLYNNLNTELLNQNIYQFEIKLRESIINQVLNNSYELSEFETIVENSTKLVTTNFKSLTTTSTITSTTQPKNLTELSTMLVLSTTTDSISLFDSINSIERNLTEFNSMSKFKLSDSNYLEIDINKQDILVNSFPKIFKSVSIQLLSEKFSKSINTDINLSNISKFMLDSKIFNTNNLVEHINNQFISINNVLNIRIKKLNNEFNFLSTTVSERIIDKEFLRNLQINTVLSRVGNLEIIIDEIYNLDKTKEVENLNLEFLDKQKEVENLNLKFLDKTKEVENLNLEFLDKQKDTDLLNIQFSLKEKQMNLIELSKNLYETTEKVYSNLINVLVSKNITFNFTSMIFMETTEKFSKLDISRTLLIDKSLKNQTTYDNLIWYDRLLKNTKIFDIYATLTKGDNNTIIPRLIINGNKEKLAIQLNILQLNINDAQATIINADTIIDKIDKITEIFNNWVTSKNKELIINSLEILNKEKITDITDLTNLDKIKEVDTDGTNFSFSLKEKQMNLIEISKDLYEKFKQIYNQIVSIVSLDKEKITDITDLTNLDKIKEVEFIDVSFILKEKPTNLIEISKDLYDKPEKLYDQVVSQITLDTEKVINIFDSVNVNKIKDISLTNLIVYKKSKIGNNLYAYATLTKGDNNTIIPRLILETNTTAINIQLEEICAYSNESNVVITNDILIDKITEIFNTTNYTAHIDIDNNISIKKSMLLIDKDRLVCIDQVLKELVPLKILEILQENKILQGQIHTAYKFLNLSGGETFAKYVESYNIQLADTVFKNISLISTSLLDKSKDVSNLNFNKYQIKLKDTAILLQQILIYTQQKIAIKFDISLKLYNRLLTSFTEDFSKSLTYLREIKSIKLNERGQICIDKFNKTINIDNIFIRYVRLGLSTYLNEDIILTENLYKTFSSIDRYNYKLVNRVNLSISTTEIITNERDNLYETTIPTNYESYLKLSKTFEDISYLEVFNKLNEYSCVLFNNTHNIEKSNTKSVYDTGNSIVTSSSTILEVINQSGYTNIIKSELEILIHQASSDFSEVTINKDIDILSNVKLIDKDAKQSLSLLETTLLDKYLNDKEGLIINTDNLIDKDDTEYITEILQVVEKDTNNKEAIIDRCIHLYDRNLHVALVETTYRIFSKIMKVFTKVIPFIHNLRIGKIVTVHLSLPLINKVPRIVTKNIEYQVLVNSLGRNIIQDNVVDWFNTLNRNTTILDIYIELQKDSNTIFTNLIIVGDKEKLSVSIDEVSVVYSKGGKVSNLNNEPTVIELMESITSIFNAYVYDKNEKSIKNSSELMQVIKHSKDFSFLKNILLDTSKRAIIELKGTQTSKFETDAILIESLSVSKDENEYYNFSYFALLELYQRWYFMQQKGPYDNMILPSDYPYATLPILGINTHPIPWGFDKGTTEIKVDINIMANVIDFCKELWYSNLQLYTRFTPNQSLKHFVKNIYDWLDKYTPENGFNPPEYFYNDYKIFDTQKIVSPDYWRLYRWIRWYSESLILNVPSCDVHDINKGNIYVKRLIDDLIKYFNDHHGIYGVPGHKLINKVKGNRHLFIKGDDNNGN